jgi:hypothetical protein
VGLAETLLDRKGEFVALWGLTRGIPPDLEWEATHLRRGQSAFWRKGDVKVQAWKDKSLVRMRSTINYMTIVTTERKERKTNMEIKKLMLFSSKINS